jgi:hypothetical protein
MRGGLELDGGAGVRNLPAEQEIEGLTCFRIDENVTAAFDCVLDAAGTMNRFGFGCSLVRRLSNRNRAKNREQ